jgi:hypothetical protein
MVYKIVVLQAHQLKDYLTVYQSLEKIKQSHEKSKQSNIILNDPLSSQHLFADPGK